MADKIRVQFDFTPEAQEDLIELQKDVGASTKAETVRYALQTLRWVTNQLQLGNKILVQENEKSPPARVVFPYVRAEQRAANEQLRAAGKRSSAAD